MGVPAMSVRPIPRGKSFTGLTHKERERQLSSLDGASAYRASKHVSITPNCARCVARRNRLAELEKEFAQLRRKLINVERELSEQLVDQQTPQHAASPADIALVQESAKLRITIDTLMRFQVSCALSWFSSTLLAYDLFA